MYMYLYMLFSFVCFRDVTEELLQVESWKDSLLNQRIIKDKFATSNNIFSTPLRLLITKYPQLAKEALDGFIEDANVKPEQN